MSELLQNWLNNEVGLSTNVSNFEKDFASGYLFGEILQKFRQQDDFGQFVNRSTYEAKISNYKKLEPTFKALGIKFNATQSNAIMNSDRGAALRLLYQLKMAAERLMIAGSGSVVENAQAREAPTLTGSGVTKGIRVPRDQFDGHERRFFEHRLRATGLNVKQARMDKVTKKYEIEMHKQELVAFEMDNIEQAHIAEQREIHRFSLRERLRQNKGAKDEWNARSADLWQDNMQVRLSREAADVRFNNRTFHMQQEKLDRTRDFASTDVHRGVKDFETGLATLGLSKKLEARTLNGIPDQESSEDDEDEDLHPERLLAQTTKAATGRDLVEALQSRLPSGQELEQEAGLFMRKIKESKHAGSIARRERERRRRRVLVEQQREQEMLEDSKLEEVLLEKLGRESIEEAGISYSTWRTRTFEEVVARNRQARQKEYSACRKADQVEALRRDQDLLQEMIETMREQEERERVRYRALERGRHAARRAKLSEECENILELVAQMAFASLQQEQLTDKEEVDPTLWREWMALFEENVPVTLCQSTADPCPLTARPELEVGLPESPLGVTLHNAALRDYVESKGPWELLDSGAGDADADGAEVAAVPKSADTIFAPAAEAKTAIEECPEISFIDKLSAELDTVESRPVNYRLGVIVASMLDRTYKMPSFPPPPPMPEVPLRVVISGKPFAGKRTVAGRLAEAYNLKVVEVGDVVRECLLLSKRPDLNAANPVDVLSFAAEAADEHCQRCELDGNPYARQLQEIGFEMQRLLDQGQAMPDELYVHMIVTKIRSLFPENIPKQEQPAAVTDDAEAEAAVAAGDEGEGLAPDVTALEGEFIDLEGTAQLDSCPPVAAGMTLQPEGWVLVGFPDDAPRLALLERFLSGWVDPKATPTPQATLFKAEAALLAPRPPEELPPVVRQPGGYDLHMRLELPMDESVRRACGRRVDPVTSLEYHIEDTPPPNKLAVIYERLVPVDGLAKSMGTLTTRIHNFDVAQPEVDQILSYFGPFPDVPRLVCVEAHGAVDDVYEAMEEQVAMLLERKKAELATKAAAEEAAKAEVEAAAQAKAEAEAAVQVEATDVEVAAAGPEAPTPTPPADVEASPLPTPEEPAPFVQVQLEDLPQHVEKLEDAVFNLLVEEWRSLQGDFVHSLQQLFGWHRSHLVDFRSGLYGIKQRFVEFLQRTDNRQSLVDNFVQRFNAFTEEYPDMRKQDATKNELHQRSDELHERLRKEVENRQSEALVQLEAIKGSRWVESQTEVLAAQVQHAVQLEVRRYHSACQLLEDFYYSSMQLGLPEAREAPPRVDAFAEDEPPPEDPKAKKAPPPKPKKGAAEEPVVPEVSPEEKASFRLCKWVAPAPPAEGAEQPPADVAVVVGHWEFPFLKDLFVQAKKAVWKLQDFAPPKIDLPVKEDPAEKVDPKAKGKAKAKPKAKGKDKDVEEVAPAPLMPLPPLFVDLQQAIVHERATFVHRLSMIHGWSERRLLEVASSSKSTFEHLQDWVALRRRKELDASAGLVDIIKEHIESEDFIKTKLNFQNGHLHRRPNVLLRAPIPEAIPPPVEGISPFRWTIDQLDGLLEVMGNAAAALSPSRRMLPTHVALSILQQLTSATESDRKPVKVPAVWRSCGINKLRSLVSLFEHPPSTGSVDIVEFLLHIGLLHSPLGWPSINALLEVRKALEAQAPRGCAWPDFYVTADQLAQTTLFADPTGLEESFAKKFKPVTTQQPGMFDRSHMQLGWVLRVLRRFSSPTCMQQAWELEAAWYDHKVRRAEEADRWVEMLDDVRSDPSDTPRQPVDSMPTLLADPDSDNNEDLHSLGGLSAAESEGKPERPRPEAPKDLPLPGPDSVSMRQLMGYLCQGSSVEDGVARAFAVFAPTDAVATGIPVAIAHHAALQLGCRPLPPLVGGDARPAFPTLQTFCQEIDNKYGGSVRETDLVCKSEAVDFLKGCGIARRHRRAEVEKLFPKVHK